jgi:hypothetical protein
MDDPDMWNEKVSSEQSLVGSKEVDKEKEYLE